MNEVEFSEDLQWNIVTVWNVKFFFIFCDSNIQKQIKQSTSVEIDDQCVQHNSDKHDENGALNTIRLSFTQPANPTELKTLFGLFIL